MKETQQNSAEALSGPRARLLELSQARGVSLAALSELVGRNPTYLQQFIRKGSPRKLEEQDRATLARFFGVDEQILQLAINDQRGSPSAYGASGKATAGDGRAVALNRKA